MPVSVTVTTSSVVLPVGADGHAAPVGRELDRVGQQVEHHLFESQLVGFDLADVVGDVQPRW